MNVLREEKKQQAIALGRLGWSLRRIQNATRVRHETATGYLKAAGIPVRPPGQWGRPRPQVSTCPGTRNQPMGTDQPARRPSASACEPYRPIIEAALSKGCSAMSIFQDLMDNHGFPGRSSSVKRFVRKLRGLTPVDTRLMFPTTIGDNRSARRFMARQSAFNWMRRVLQGEFTPTLLCSEMGSLPALDKLLTTVTEGRLSDRNRALAVLARNKGLSLTDVCGFLSISKEAVLKYCRCYRAGGFELLMSRKSPSTTKFDKEQNKQAVFALLHTPPSAYGINRTTWRMVDLQAVLKKQGSPLCTTVIRTILKQAGYRWRSARIVLTSTDPDYRTKVEGIKKILSELGRDEAFFSIDEYGPFAVKKKGGVKRVAPGQEYVVPQRQKSKGWLILTAALELSTNQVSHFYSRTKNTDEMIKMAELLRTQYRACRTVYLSWDAASWHISKKLRAHLEGLNKHAEPDGYPVVKTAPLPAGAQFLNVIESVFSGMARAIIHNSDYSSVEAAKEAIDLYFSERNAHFSKHPKRAGQKIWRMERVPSEFREGQNCKDPLYG
jgi:transposase